MAVHIKEGLEPASHWQRVGELANELLSASSLRDWTVTLAPQDSGRTPMTGEARWASDIDYGSRSFRIGVPSNPDDLDETSPEDAATYVVLDLLGDSVSELEAHVLPLAPRAGASASLFLPPSAEQHGDGSGQWTR